MLNILPVLPPGSEWRQAGGWGQWRNRGLNTTTFQISGGGGHTLCQVEPGTGNTRWWRAEVN